MTRKLSPHEKKGRKPASRACVFCHSKHLQCSNERPCKNCVKRNLGDQCNDVVRKRAKYLNTAGKRAKTRTNSYLSSGGQTPDISDSPIFIPPQEFVKSEEPDIQPHIITQEALQDQDCQPIPPQYVQSHTSTRNTLHYGDPRPVNSSNNMLNTTNDVLNKLLFNDPKSSEDITLGDPVTRPQDISTAGGNIDNMFNSNYLNQEYNMLGDILLHSKPSSPSPSNTSASEYNADATISPANTLLANANVNFNNPNPGNSHERKGVRMSKLKDSRPFIALGFPKEMEDAASDNILPNIMPNTNNITNKNEIMDQEKVAQVTNKNNYIPPLLSHHIYQSVQDIYNNNISNFDYPQSYHLLTHFLKRRFLGNSLSTEEKQAKRNNLLIILKLIASYRPTFISAHKNLLKPFDLLFLEMSFQRSLIDYEKLLLFNSSPTVIWRRTGEIVSISNDLLSILGFNLNEILSKRTFIMELMYDDESIINYFKLFKSVAVGNLHLSIITKCKLMKSSSVGFNNDNTDITEKEYIEFCSVWTVKRDLFDIPMLIIGQFLPVLPGGEGVRKY